MRRNSDVMRHYLSRMLWSPLAEALVVACCVLISCAGLLFAQQQSYRRTIDLTQVDLPQDMIFSGVYGRELNGTFAYRWTDGYFLTHLRWGYHAAPAYRATIRLRAALPETAPLTLLTNERPLASAQPAAEFRRYQLLLPPAPDGDADLRFALQIAPQIHNGDWRPLGVVVTDVTLVGQPSINWTASIVIPLLMVGVWLLARRTAGRTALWLLTLLSLLPCALPLVFAPSPLPWTMLLLLSLAGTAAGLLLTRNSLHHAVLAALTAVVTFSGMIWPDWLSDDALISFRYAHNLAAGHGLVYNIGERVEGYTNFLYTVLIAVVLRLNGDPLLWSYLSGVIFALVLVLLAYALAARLIGPTWGLVTALIVATSQSLLLHSARGGGLETAFFAVLVLAATTVYCLPPAANPSETPASPATQRLIGTGILLALATLTRPEGVLLCALTFGHALLYRLRLRDLPRRIVDLRALPIVYLLIIVPFFLWRLNYYGDLLPNTFYAKTGGGIAAVLRGLSYAAAFALTLGGPFLLVGLVGVVLQRGQPSQRWRSYLLLVCSTYSSYIIAVGGDHFIGERFFVPLLALFALLLTDGLHSLSQRFISDPTVTRVVQIASLPLLCLSAAYALTRSDAIAAKVHELDRNLVDWTEIGYWMADHAAPDETIAVKGAGAVAFYGQRTTIDMLGLMDRHIARVEVATMGSGAAGHEKSDPAYVLAVRQPTYVPDMWADYFPPDSRFRELYELRRVTTRHGRTLLIWQRHAE